MSLMQSLANTQYKIKMNIDFQVCCKCPTNWDINKFQESTQVLPIFGALRGPPLQLANFEKKKKSINDQFSMIVVPIFLWVR